MSLRLTQGDENHLDSPIMILRGLEVVFDCVVNGCALTALVAEVRHGRLENAHTFLEEEGLV